MTNTVATRPPGLRNSAGPLAGRLLAATALTAAIGALGNAIYERMFDPEAYAAGPVIARAAFAFILPFPIILAGLVFVGAPVAYALSRLRLDSVIVFAIAGAAAGDLIGLATAATLPKLQMLFAGYGCASAIAYWALRFRRA